MLSALENTAFFETLMLQTVVRYESSAVFINYEVEDLKNFQNSQTDLMLQHHNSALD